MGFFGSKKRRSAPPAPEVDHLGYPVGPPRYASQSRDLQKWQPPNESQSSQRPSAPAVYPSPSHSAPSSSYPSGHSSPYQNQGQYRPIIVNQHYYLNPAASHPSSCGPDTLNSLGTGSVANLPNQIVPMTVAHQYLEGPPRWHPHATQLINQGAALYDQIQSKLNDVLTLIDCDKLLGNEQDLSQYDPGLGVGTTVLPPPPPRPESRGHSRHHRKKSAPKGQTTAVVASTLFSGGSFSKVEFYVNSRLPLNLPPLRLYMPTWPLVCLAAQYSERVYETPRGHELDCHIDADWRSGTKAMRIKSVPMDHMNTIVFAIRGTATFADWAVNLNTAPTPPIGFLDDTSNYCHAGFLSAARKMIRPVAFRLRHLLEENPRRSNYSLLITGHSAGGAVASLLYAHMLSTSKESDSELNELSDCFKRIHCVTFGTPPVSVLPLTKPNWPELKKSLFLSFINEGDPVVRADKAYVKSLIELYASPEPTQSQLSRSSTGDEARSSASQSSHLRHSTRERRTMSSPPPYTPHASINPHAYEQSSQYHPSGPDSQKPVWRVPPSPLSNAGRIVVLRSGNPNARLRGKRAVEERLNEGVVAQVASDEELRGVIWGDPMCHLMRLYAGRIETLAVGAVTAKGY